MNIAIVGLGLMGGSLGRAIVKQGEHKIYAYDVNPDAMLKVDMMRAFDYQLDIENDSLIDLFIVATRTEYFKDICDKFIPYLKNGAIVTDFCGVKRTVVALMEEYKSKYPELNFVGGHPMAGREFSGIEHSKINLFDKASMILVPVHTDIFVMETLKAFYLSLGFSEVVITSAENHDNMIAFTSQLCHIVSNAFIKNKTADKHFGYSAGSYKDLTRVARLDPDMWAGLMSMNKDFLLPELDELIESLKEYQKALKTSDSEYLRQLLADGNDRKLKIDTKNTKKV